MRKMNKNDERNNDVSEKNCQIKKKKREIKRTRENDRKKSNLRKKQTRNHSKINVDRFKETNIKLFNLDFSFQKFMK